MENEIVIDIKTEMVSMDIRGNEAIGYFVLKMNDKAIMKHKMIYNLATGRMIFELEKELSNENN